MKRTVMRLHLQFGGSLSYDCSKANSLQITLLFASSKLVNIHKRLKNLPFFVFRLKDEESSKNFPLRKVPESIIVSRHHQYEAKQFRTVFSLTK